MQHGKPVLTRNYKDWTIVVRNDNPVGSIKKQKEDLIYSDELGGYLMKFVDYSGKNHKLLVKPCEKNPQYYEVLGAFTSSTTPYDGRFPHLVSSYNLEDDTKAQLFHKYNKPIFIPKNRVENCSLETKVLDDLEYSKFCELVENDRLQEINKTFIQQS